MTLVEGGQMHGRERYVQGPRQLSVQHREVGRAGVHGGFNKHTVLRNALQMREEKKKLKEREGEEIINALCLGSFWQKSSVVWSLGLQMKSFLAVPTKPLPRALYCVRPEINQRRVLPAGTGTIRSPSWNKQP